MLRMCSAPSDVGYIPEIIVVRAGAQTGAVDQAALQGLLRLLYSLGLPLISVNWLVGSVNDEVDSN